MASLATLLIPGDLLWWEWALPECPLRPPLYVGIVLIDVVMSPR